MPGIWGLCLCGVIRMPWEAGHGVAVKEENKGNSLFKRSRGRTVCQWKIFLRKKTTKECKAVFKNVQALVKKARLQRFLMMRRERKFPERIKDGKRKVRRF